MHVPWNFFKNVEIWAQELPMCLSQGLYSWTKHHDQESSWGGKGLFSLHIAVHHQRKSGLELKQVRSWYRGHGGMLLTGLLPLACSACFRIEPSATSPGMAPPTMGPPHLITNWENALQLDPMEAFPQGRIFFSVITPACVKLIHKTSQYTM